MPNNRPQLQSITKYLIISILLVALFSVLEILLYRFSFNYVVYEDFVSWYFPVGLRVVSFLLLPLRYWPALLIANATGQLMHGWFYSDRDYSPIWGLYLRTLTYQFIPLLPIFILKYKKLELDITKVKNMTLILGACIFYRAVRTPTLLLSELPSKLYADISADQKFEMVLAHLLGGVITILYLLLLSYVAILLWRYRRNIFTSDTANFLYQLSAILGCFVGLYAIEPNVLYLLRLLAIFPLIWFAYRHGYLGCMIYAICISTLLLANVYGVNQTDLLMTTQMYIINYILMAFILGAFIAEHNRATEALVDSNNKLFELNQLTHALASKAVNAQESERKSLSQELHDEVGQNLTALKTYLRLAEKENATMGTNQNKFLEISMNAADRIYDSVYHLMHWLRPRVIDELGLSQALRGEQFSSLLHNAGISFDCQIEGDYTRLSDEQQIAIYRICQESVTNTIKHSSAAQFKIKLNIKDDITNLEITDNGSGFPDADSNLNKGGFGLQGIKERVLLLNGQCQISGEQGFSISIELPLSLSV